MNIPDEINNLDRQYWIDKILGKFDVGTIEKKTKKSKSFKSFLNRTSTNVFEFAPDAIKNDEEIVLLALDKFKTHLHNIGQELLNNKDFILKYVEQTSYPSFFSVPLKLKEDRDVFFAYYRKTTSCFKDLLWDSRKFYNRDDIKELLQINGDLMGDLPNKFKDDLELAKIVIDQNPQNIKLLNKRTAEKICVDKDYCKNLLDSNINAFEYINLKLRSDKDFVLPYINQKISLIEKLSKKLRSDKEFMKPFISWFSCIYSLGENLKKDPELMLEAAKHHTGIIHYIDDSLKNVDFCIKLVEVNPNTYKYFPKEIQREPNVIITLLTHEYCVDNELKQIDSVNILNKDELEICTKEYYNLPNNQNLDFNKFVRGKYLNLSLNTGLNKENNEIYDDRSKPKKLKI